jgi:hypothetical protein
MKNALILATFLAVAAGALYVLQRKGLVNLSRRSLGTWAVGVFLFLQSVFEPRAKASMEYIEERKDLGGGDQESGQGKGDT